MRLGPTPNISGSGDWRSYSICDGQIPHNLLRKSLGSGKHCSRGGSGFTIVCPPVPGEI